MGEPYTHDIRVVMIEGAPWFVAADLLPALGWSRENLRYHQRSTLIAGERGVAKLPTIGRGEQAYAIISESGLYKLVMRSDKPEARAFQDWVTREVLPSIRKDGGYIHGEEKVRRLHLRWS